jgi:hypothetical protein
MQASHPNHSIGNDTLSYPVSTGSPHNQVTVGTLRTDPPRRRNAKVS